MKRILVAGTYVLFGLLTTSVWAKDLPNIVLILADDLGYGDLRCYNPESRVPTPNLDRLAASGMRFTDAHAPATFCVPTRYSLLTGRLQFRSKIPMNVEVGSSCIIEEDRLTLPQMLKEQGYATAMTGKWHLGLTYMDKLKPGQPLRKRGIASVKQIDFSRPIPDGPLNRGFDRFFGTEGCPGTSLMYAYIDGNRIPVPPTRQLTGELKRELEYQRHEFAIDCDPGMIAPDFDHDEIDMLFLEKSRDFIKEHVKTSSDKPFFLYHAMQAVHLPSFPADQFMGKSGVSPHGDFIFEMDYIVGEFVETLEELGIAKNTIILFCSDNGPETPTVRIMRSRYYHDGARPWRGVKRDNWEGGHRVPLIAYWPGRIEAGSVSDQTVNLTDIMATCAAIVGAQLPNDSAEDSFDMLPVLFGKQRQNSPVRRYSLQQAFRGHFLSIRKGPWKYLNHKGSGGNNYKAGGLFGAAGLDIDGVVTDPDVPGQLYNLDDDPGEKHNLFAKHPEIVKQLKAKMDQFVRSGRSAPGRE